MRREDSSSQCQDYLESLQARCCSHTHTYTERHIHTQHTHTHTYTHTQWLPSHSAVTPTRTCARNGSHRNSNAWTFSNLVTAATSRWGEGRRGREEDGEGDRGRPRERERERERERGKNQLDGEGERERRRGREKGRERATSGFLHFLSHSLSLSSSTERKEALLGVVSKNVSQLSLTHGPVLLLLLLSLSVSSLSL